MDQMSLPPGVVSSSAGQVDRHVDALESTTASALTVISSGTELTHRRSTLTVWLCVTAMLT
jgi:hypothetical protein